MGSLYSKIIKDENSSDPVYYKIIKKINITQVQICDIIDTIYQLIYLVSSITIYINNHNHHINKDKAQRRNKLTMKADNFCQSQVFEKDNGQNNTVNIQQFESQLFNLTQLNSLKDFNTENTQIVQLIIPQCVIQFNINYQIMITIFKQNTTQLQQFQIIEAAKINGHQKLQSKYFLIFPNNENTKFCNNTYNVFTQCTDLKEIGFQFKKYQKNKIQQYSQEHLYESNIINKIIDFDTIITQWLDLQNQDIKNYNIISLDKFQIAFKFIQQVQYINLLANFKNESLNCLFLHNNNLQIISLVNDNFKLTKTQRCIKIVFTNNQKNKLFNYKALTEDQQKYFVQILIQLQQNNQIIFKIQEIQYYDIPVLSLLQHLQYIELTNVTYNIIFPPKIKEIYIHSGGQFINNFDFQHLTDVREISISQCFINSIQFSNVQFHFNLNENTQFTIDTYLLENSSFDFMIDVQDLEISYLNSIDLLNQQKTNEINQNGYLDFSVFHSLGDLSLLQIQKKVILPDNLVTFFLSNSDITVEKQALQYFDFSKYKLIEDIYINYTQIDSLIIYNSPKISNCNIKYLKTQQIDNISQTYVNCYEPFSIFQLMNMLWQKANLYPSRQLENWIDMLRDNGLKVNEEYFCFWEYNYNFVEDLLKYESFNGCIIGIVDLSNEKQSIDLDLCTSYYKHVTKFFRLKETSNQSLYSMRNKKYITLIRKEMILALKIHYIYLKIQKLLEQ